VVFSNGVDNATSENAAAIKALMPIRNTSMETKILKLKAKN
jgi:hypothetical protein